MPFTKDTARIIVETHRADYLLSIKGNSPETCEHLEEWERDADASFSEEADLAHGRQRHIHVVRPLPGAYPHGSCSAQVQTTARYAHLAPVKASAARIGDSIERDLAVETD